MYFLSIVILRIVRELSLSILRSQKVRDKSPSFFIYLSMIHYNNIYYSQLSFLEQENNFIYRRLSRRNLPKLWARIGLSPGRVQKLRFYALEVDRFPVCHRVFRQRDNKKRGIGKKKKRERKQKKNKAEREREREHGGIKSRIEFLVCPLHNFWRVSASRNRGEMWI